MIIHDSDHPFIGMIILSGHAERSHNEHSDHPMLQMIIMDHPMIIMDHPMIVVDHP